MIKGFSKMRKPKLFKVLAVFSFAMQGILVMNSPAQTVAAAYSTSGTQLMPLASIKEGMHGTARTVFQGSTPEDFGVEILGVLPGAIGPKQDLIIGRLSGAAAERTQVFAGMSGSPVYIDGKLIGAISYSFPFSKEPICGITPIEQMIAIFEKQQPAKAASTEPRVFSFAQLASSVWSPDLPGGQFAQPASSTI